MADILLDNQSTPTTPASGTSVVYVDTTTKILAAKNDAGQVQRILQSLNNGSTANQTGFAADTYLAGSNIAIPNSILQIGTTYRLVFDMVKTAAGTATSILVIRIGTLGTVADAARLTFTFAAGTAAIDTGKFEVTAHFRSIGSGTSAVLVGLSQCDHHLAATGLTSTGASGNAILMVTSAGFDSTVANSIIGASFNGGASFAGTNVVVESSLINTCI